MNASVSSRPDVLVVGAGPVGLTLAHELTRHGVACRIVDQLEAPPTWSKAAAVTPRTLEAFDLMGVVPDVLERGRPMRGFNLYRGQERLTHIDLHIQDSIYDTMFGISQREIELLLASHLERRGVHLERPVRLVRFSQQAGGVTAMLAHPDGREETLEVPWMVACDGAKSTLRKGLELAFEGSTHEQSLVQADVRIDWPFPVESDEAQVFLSENGVIGALPLLAEGRYRLLVVPGDELEPNLEYFQRQMALRGPAGAVVRDPAWMIGFRFHSRIASRYRVGNIFLAGDAAHIHSPAGAQGMNMGIQDAFNLAWKLALVIRGGARPSILDSYEPERRPVAEAVVGGTDRGFKTAMWVNTIRNPVAQALRNQIISFVTSFPAIQEMLSNTVSGTWLAYPDSPITGQHQVSVWSAHVVSSSTVEHPGVRDWLDFGKGPGPGERVPDVPLGIEQGGRRRVFDFLRTGAHTLFLFDGAAPTEAGYRTLAAIGEQVQASFGPLIDVHIVVPSDRRPVALPWTGPVVLDADGALHQRFGARSECLYLIRPDSYVGFRSQPADGQKLLEYLDTIFVRA